MGLNRTQSIMGKGGDGWPAAKKDWRVCQGLFCCNQYIVCPPSACLTLEATVCCISEEAACCMFGGDDKRSLPSLCAVWGLACYPTFGCCNTVKQLYDGNDEVLNGIPNDKEDYRVCHGICCGPLATFNAYCLMPKTCCKQEQQCLCLAMDASFPCLDSVPSTCSLYGINCYPGFGCCQTVEALMGAENMEKAEGGEGGGQSPPTNQA